MSLGLAYDSDAGRAYAAAITALMTGHAYAVSARSPHASVRSLATRIGSPCLRFRQHRDAAQEMRAAAASDSNKGMADVRLVPVGEA